MLGKDFREFVALLNAQGVEYLIVGAYAVGAHGHPRYTGDLDVWVRPTVDNSARTVAAVNAFGFASFEVPADGFSQPGKVLQLGGRPLGIDIMTSVAGVEFDTAWQRRMTVDLEGLPVHFLGLEDLVASKKATGRPKDLGDLDELGKL